MNILTLSAQIVAILTSDNIEPQKLDIGKTTHDDTERPDSFSISIHLEPTTDTAYLESSIRALFSTLTYLDSSDVMQYPEEESDPEAYVSHVHVYFSVNIKENHETSNT